MNTSTEDVLWWWDTEGTVLQRNLHDPYWAEIGPVSYAFGWSWAIYHGNDEIDGGWSADEAGAKAAVADWAEADLTVSTMAAEIADGVLSEAFSRYGITPRAFDQAELAVTATTQIRRT